MDFFDFRERAGSGVDEETEALARAVIGAAIEVHKHLRPGMPENAYKLALSHELKLRGIPHEVEVPVPILYKGIRVGEGFLDVLVDKRLILELKAVEALHEVHRAQLLGYLQAPISNSACSSTLTSSSSDKASSASSTHTRTFAADFASSRLRGLCSP